MDFSKPINAKAKRPKRWGRRVLLGLLGLLVLVVALVALAPTLLSTGAARRFVLGKVNAAIAPATLEVGDWSFAWTRDQSLSDIRYADARQGIDARVRKVGVSSLWELVPVGKITARVEVEAPVVAYAPPKPVEPAPVAEPTPPTPSGTEGAEVAPAAPFVLPAWEVSAEIRVTDASFAMEGFPEPLATLEAVSLTMPSLEADIAFTAKGAAQGVAAEAEAALPSVRALLEAKAPNDFFKTVSAQLKAAWLDVEVAATAKPGEAWPEASARAGVDVPGALAFAKGLGVQVEGVAATSGKATLSAKMGNGAKGAVRVEAAFATEGLACSVQGKPLAANPKAEVVAEADPANLMGARIERLTLALPGATAQGQGSLEAGSLTARIVVEELLEAFRPFVGEVALPGPLTVEAEARAADGGLGLTLRGLSKASELASLSVKAQGVDVATQSVRDAQVGLKADLAAAMAFLGAPGPKGTLSVNATAGGSAQSAQADVSFALRDVAVASGAWKIEETALLEGVLKATYDGAVAKVTDLVLVSPVAALQGGAEYALGKPLGEAVKANLSGRLSPVYALEKWHVPAKGSELPQLAGGIDLSVAATPASGPIPRVTASAKSQDFSVTLKGLRAIAAPFSLNVEAEGDEAGYALRAFALETPYASVTAQGDFETKGGKVTLEGMLEPDFAQIWGLPFLDPYRELGLAVEGKHAKPFRFEAPVLNGLPGILNEGTAEASLAFDRVTVPGLDIPDGSATLTLADARVALDAEVAVNGGTLRLNPRVAVAAEPYVLTIPEDTKLLDAVGLTQAMLDEGLGAVNPVLAGSATPAGTVDVVCDSLRMELGGNPLEALEAELTLLTHGVSVQPNGTLGTLLNLVRLRNKVATLPDQDFSVRVSKGVLTCDPITMRIAAVKLDCRGTTNLLTREVDYTISLPLTEDLLGDRLAKRLNIGDVIQLPIHGTMDRPIVETKPLMEALSNSAIGRATERVSEKLSEKLGDALKKAGATGKDAGKSADKAVDNLENALRGLFNRDR